MNWTGGKKRQTFSKRPFSKKITKQPLRTRINGLAAVDSFISQKTASASPNGLSLDLFALDSLKFQFQNLVGNSYDESIEFDGIELNSIKESESVHSLVVGDCESQFKHSDYSDLPRQSSKTWLKDQSLPSKIININPATTRIDIDYLIAEIREMKRTIQENTDNIQFLHEKIDRQTNEQVDSDDFVVPDSQESE